MLARLLLILSAAAAISSVQAQSDTRQSDAAWDEDGWEDTWDEDEQGLGLHGFIEPALGSRWDTDPVVGASKTLNDLRARAEAEWALDWATLSFKADVLYDGVEEAFDGDFRDLTLAFSPGEKVDVKLGRQVLTWGTGDLLFLNDLFPKDFVSFFAGRDDEYLKAPSNSARVSVYGDAVNVEVAWTPVFEPDNYLTGERFSFFSPRAGTSVAPILPLAALKPEKSMKNGELALRLFKTIRGVEYAAYGYHGFFKQPNALTTDLVPTFAPLTALGASVRRPLGAGLLNGEISYYFSRDDPSGTDPRVPNDQLRLLVGYEREAITNLTVGFQWYLEWTRDHDALLANSPTPQFEPEEQRHVLTNRLSYRALRDKLSLSLFTFYSPTDRDYYLRPQLSYRYSDRWSLASGANVFDGREQHTFFGQLEDASNVYFRIRFSY